MATIITTLFHLLHLGSIVKTEQCFLKIRNVSLVNLVISDIDERQSYSVKDEGQKVHVAYISPLHPLQPRHQTTLHRPMGSWRAFGAFAICVATFRTIILPLDMRVAEMSGLRTHPQIHKIRRIHGLELIFLHQKNDGRGLTRILILVWGLQSQQKFTMSRKP